MNKIYAVLLMSVSTIFGAASEIYKTGSLDRLYQEIPRLGENSLVVFDRDDTLLQGIDCISVELREQFVLLWQEIYSTESVDLLMRNIESQRHVLVDTKVVALIKQLRAQNVNVIIMTRGCYGPGATGKNVEDLCLHVFQSVGINLQDSFAAYSNSVLSSVVNNGNSPLFKKGVLFGNTCDKGQTLEAFLKLVKINPDYVIFVDDKLDYVQEVQAAAQRNAIPFLGLHYRGAEKLPVPDLREQCYRMCYLLGRDLGL